MDNKELGKIVKLLESIDERLKKIERNTAPKRYVTVSGATNGPFEQPDYILPVPSDIDAPEERDEP